VFPSRIHDSPHLGTRQYARILERWVLELGLGPADYGTHSRSHDPLVAVQRLQLRLLHVAVRELK